MKSMSTEDFCERFNACEEGTAWALDYADMRTCYDALMRGEAGDDSTDWAVWVVTRPGVMSYRDLRLFAVRCARRVKHLMRDQRSITALDVAERHALGQATDEELTAARNAAQVAGDAAWDAARAAAKAAAVDAAKYAAKYAAWAAWAAWAAAQAAARNAAQAAGAAARAARAAAQAAGDDALDAERAEQLKLLAEFGNPFE